MKIKAIAYIILLTILYSCGTSLTGYDFSTNAFYTAPKSGISVILKAQGHVKAGEDIGKGIVKGRIIIADISDTINFVANSQQFKKLTCISRAKLCDPSDFVGTIIKLYEMDKKKYNINEIKELKDVIKAVATGPKGTYMVGQTQYIIAKDINFNRK